MKKVILIIAILFLLAGCGENAIRLDGFSVGVLYLNTDVTTDSSKSLGMFGTATDHQVTHIEEIIPVALLNFKFGKIN